MQTTETSAPPRAVAAPRLAIASGISGILALGFVGSLPGAFFGVAGLALGILHLSQGSKQRSHAWVGILFSAFALAASIRGGLAPREAFDQWVGVPAPDFSATTLDGQTVTLSNLKGKRVLLNFWSPTCPGCVAEMPDLNRLHRETSRDDLVILGVSSDSPAELLRFLKRREVSFPTVLNVNLPPPFNAVQLIPTTFFIDRQGIIQSVALGQHGFEQFKDAALTADYSGPPKPSPLTRQNAASDSPSAR